MTRPILQLAAVTKDYPGVRALDTLDFDLRAGEIHVLLGENGAGKSTLISIIAGANKPTSGQVTLKGTPVSFQSPKHARQHGVAAVWQEFSLIRSMSVAENLFMGTEHARLGFLSKQRMRAEAQAFIAKLGFDIDVGEIVGDMTRGRQQMVEIAKALMTAPEVLILDEPTASLTEAESEHLFAFIKGLRDQGVAIIYISHRMKEIRALADRITIMRDGRRIDTRDNDTITDDALIALMSGRPVSEIYPPKATATGDDILSLDGLTLADGRLHDVSLRLRRGEIVGIAGLVGCGKSEVGRAIFGLETLSAGEIRFKGQPYRDASPAKALAQGICYFPSDRAVEGLALGRSVVENATMPALDLADFNQNGLIRRGHERSASEKVLATLNLRPLHLDKPASAFSGGNKQKIVLARGLLRDVDLYIFDEPTVGIDVTAKAEIYAIIAGLAAKGAAVLMISSELPEVIGLSHRVYVMNHGHIACELAGDDICEEAILPHFFTH